MAQPTLVQSVFIILLAASAVVGIILGLPYIVAQLMPEYESWIRAHIFKLIPALFLVLMPVVLLWSNKKLSTYKRGDDPLAMARMMVTFGSKRKAIRYLESVPRDHPRADKVKMQINKLRQET